MLRLHWNYCAGGRGEEFGDPYPPTEPETYAASNLEKERRGTVLLTGEGEVDP